MGTDTTSKNFECLYNIGKKCTPALEMLAQKVAEDTDRYVPWRTGWLKSCVRIEDNTSVRKRIVYYASYASECYYANHPFSKRRNALATARWFEASKSANLDNWRKAAVEELFK